MDTERLEVTGEVSVGDNDRRTYKKVFLDTNPYTHRGGKNMCLPLYDKCDKTERKKKCAESLTRYDPIYPKTLKKNY